MGINPSFKEEIWTVMLNLTKCICVALKCREWMTASRVFPIIQRSNASIAEPRQIVCNMFVLPIWKMMRPVLKVVTVQLISMKSASHMRVGKPERSEDAKPQLLLRRLKRTTLLQGRCLQRPCHDMFNFLQICHAYSNSTGISNVSLHSGHLSGSTSSIRGRVLRGETFLSNR